MSRQTKSVALGAATPKELNKVWSVVKSLHRNEPALEKQQRLGLYVRIWPHIVLFHVGRSGIL